MFHVLPFSAAFGVFVHFIFLTENKTCFSLSEQKIMERMNRKCHKTLFVLSNFSYIFYISTRVKCFVFLHNFILLHIKEASAALLKALLHHKNVCDLFMDLEKPFPYWERHFLQKKTISKNSVQ